MAGTHGKTTTTAIGAWLLDAAERRPGFLVGGVVAGFDRTARPASGNHFIIEGDEYDTAFFDKGPKFLHYRPTTTILTRIEFDHADIYTDLEHCQQSFRQLMGIMPSDGCVVARTDHDAVAEVAALAECEVRLGAGQAWDGRIEGIDTDKSTMQFAVLEDGKVWDASSPSWSENTTSSTRSQSWLRWRVRESRPMSSRRASPALAALSVDKRSEGSPLGSPSSMTSLTTPPPFSSHSTHSACGLADDDSGPSSSHGATPAGETCSKTNTPRHSTQPTSPSSPIPTIHLGSRKMSE